MQGTSVANAWGKERTRVRGGKMRHGGGKLDCGCFPILTLFENPEGRDYPVCGESMPSETPCGG